MSIKKGLALLSCVLALIGPSAQAASTAEVTRGLNWLQGQIAADGSVAGETTSVATSAQVRTEIARTLRELGGSAPANLLSTLTPSAELSTEVASRATLAAAPGDPIGSTWVAALVARQLPDGSMPSFPDQGATDLDMAWALRALTGRPDISVPLLRSLASRQQADGSWTTTPYSPLHATALALCGVNPYASTNADAARAAASASTYVTAQRQSDGSWSSAVWVTAQAYECLHDYLPNADDHAGMRAWLVSRQAADGSWGQDPFVTSLALRALALTALPPLNPLQSGLRVRVADGQTGAAMSGVTLVLTGPSSLSGTTDGTGSFQQAAVAPGAYQITASRTGYASLSVSVSLNAGVIADLGVLRMSRTSTSADSTASVSGVVTDASSGQPLPGVAVAIAAAGKSALTDAQGRYAIDAVPPGTYSIAATKAGYSSIATSFAAAAGGSYVFSPRLPTVSAGGDDTLGCRVYGRLLKASDGTPVSGASIVLGGANGKSTSSDATGAYVLSGLVSGNTSIRVAAAGVDTVQVTAALACAVPSASEFSPRLYPSATSPADANKASLAFTVVDSASGLPLSGVAVDVSATGQPTRRVNSAANGRVVIDQLTLASMQAQLSLTGYDGVTLGVTISSAQLLDIGSVPMKKSRSAVATGVVTHASTGAAIQDVSVVLSGATAAQTTTDSAGRFMLTGLSEGTHNVAFSKTGFASASSTFVAVPGGEYVIAPKLKPATSPDPTACTLAGTILAAQSGQPIVGAQIVLTGANNLSTVTDATGAYSLGALVSGSTRVSVSATGFDGAMFDFGLACSRPVLTDFSPKLYTAGQAPANANTASVAFTLVDAAKGTPLSGVTVRVTPLGQAATNIVTQPDGKFTVTGLKQSAVQIQAAATGYDGVDLSFQVTPLQDIDMGQLRLRPTGNDPLLPDLQVLAATRASAVTDPQSLKVSGSLQVIVANTGLAPTDRAVEILAFEDRNRNGRYDADSDVVLGRAQLPGAIAVGGSATVSVPVSGNLLFRDAPIHVWVDSKEELAEKNETNNVRSTGDAAQLQPAIGTFKPVLKWHWDGSSSPFPTYNQVMMSPVVGRFVDTNGDGKIDSSDVPVVVFVSFHAGGGAYDAGGVIRVVNGRTGAELLTIKDTVNPVAGISGLALADLDGDGKPELIAMTLDFRVIAYRNDGSTLWVSEQINPPESNAPWGAPMVADIDGDGSPEIIFGRTVLDARGKLKWRGTGAYNGSTIAGQSGAAISVAADLFGTGQQNVIVGASVYSPFGQLMWQARDGYAAVADFDGHGEPSIAVVNAGTVALYSRTGQLRWSVPLPGGGRGGPPTIADVNGDGVPDIGVAAGTAYTVFRADGSVLWSHSSQDGTSQMTGSTVFDFNGDGSAEVLYTDEIRIRAYKGATGEVLWEIPNSSGTAIEYPLVADIDGDGHADLVTVTNDYYTPANATVLLHGVRAYQDQTNSWVNTRQVWNQHAYSITNINDDLTVPSRPTPPWTAHNTFRANKKVDGASTAVADLTASLLRIVDNGPQGRATLSVRIGNGGALAAPAGVKVAFYGVAGSSNTALGVSTTSGALGAGGFVDLSVDVSAGLAQFTKLTVVADDDGTGKQAVTDYDRSNNTLTVDIAPLATALSLSLATDTPAYQANQSALFKATVANGGSFAKTARVRYLVQTADGQPVTALPDGSNINIASGATSSDQVIWNVGSTFAGSYRVSADLLDAASDRVLASASADFIIRAGDGSGTSTLAAALQLDKGSYSPGDSLRLVDRVTNLASNKAWQGLVLQTVVRNPDSSTRWSASATLDELAASGTREQSYSVPLSNAPAGTYEVRFKVLDADGTQRAEAVKAFTVTSTASTGVGLVGHIGVSPKPAFQGSAASFAFDVANQGNAALAAMPLRVDIVAPESQQVLATMPYTVALAGGGNYAGNASWTVNAAVGTNLVAVLTAQVGGRDVALAQETFSVVEPPPQLMLESGVVPDTRLLVLVNCPPGYSGNRQTCIPARVAAIQSMLDSLNVPYKIVTSKTDFENEFRCGTYNAYWLSGGYQDLSDGLAKELREAVRRGEALLMDGYQFITDVNLVPIMGVTLPSPPKLSPLPTPLPPSPFSIIPGTPSPFAAGSATVSGLRGNLVLATAQAVAQHSNGKPAIAFGSLGSGNTWVFAFDLVGTLISYSSDATTTAWFRNGLAGIMARVANSPQAFTTGDVGALNTRAYNVGTRTTVVEWRVQLPIGTQLLSSSLTPVSLQQPTAMAVGQGVWRETVGVDSAKNLLLRVKVEATGATLDVPVSIYTIAGNGVASLYDVKTHSLATVTSDVLGANALAAVQVLAPTAAADIQARDRAVAAINQALSAPDATAALPQWIAATDELRSITTATAAAMAGAQLATAWGVEAAEDGICPVLKALQACMSGTLDITPSRTAPMGSTRTLQFTLKNSCAVGFESVSFRNIRTRRGSSAPYRTLLSGIWDMAANGSNLFSDGLNFLTSETSLTAGDNVDLDFEVVWKGVAQPVVRDSIVITPAQ